MRKRKILITSGIAIVVGVVAAGAFLGAKIIYRNGVDAGRNEVDAENLKNIDELGRAVAEKSNFIKLTEGIFEDTPEKIDETGIGEYVNKIESLIAAIEDADAKNILNEYLAAWKKFKEIYAGKNNDRISEAFAELKEKSGDTANKIKQIYDEKIKDAIEKI